MRFRLNSQYLQLRGWGLWRDLNFTSDYSLVDVLCSSSLAPFSKELRCFSSSLRVVCLLLWGEPRNAGPLQIFAMEDFWELLPRDLKWFYSEMLINYMTQQYSWMATWPCACPESPGWRQTEVETRLSSFTLAFAPVALFKERTCHLCVKRRETWPVRLPDRRFNSEPSLSRSSSALDGEGFVHKCCVYHTH